MNKNKRKFWEHPWSYKESFLIGFSIMIIGMVLEAVTYGYAPITPVWPYNLIVLIVFILGLIVANRFVKNKFTNWLANVPAAIASICVFTVLVLLMGFIQQVRRPIFIDYIGLTDVVNSWAYLFCSLFLLLTLGMTTVNKFRSLSLKNIAFFLNHGGLWIIIVGASLGSGDLQKYQMQLIKNRSVSYVGNEFVDNFKMPFTLKLIDFHIDEYPCKIGLMNPMNGKIYLEKGDNLPEVKENGIYHLGDWEIRTEKYLASAKPRDTIYVPSEEVGSCVALYVRAINKTNDLEKEGWLSPGSFKFSSRFLPLEDYFTVVVTQPSSRKFNSKIRVFKSSDDYYDFDLEVNKPKTINGWKIYQTGYNEAMGKWSDVSIVEVVKDPWLPLVYIGIFMVLIGSLYLVWMGKSKQ